MRNANSGTKWSPEMRGYGFVLIVLMLIMLIIPPVLSYDSWMMKLHEPAVRSESGRLDEIIYDSARSKNIHLVIDGRSYRIPSWGYDGDMDQLLYRLKGVLGCFVKLQYLDLHIEDDLLLNISCGGEDYMDAVFAMMAYEDNADSEILMHLFMFVVWIFLQPLLLRPLYSARKARRTEAQRTID